eukprot:CAMPEP_0172444536 /NCGR_PEP_ID=MMETSP1065-20121228/4560_1 /TAXON_ID=265537 /ORGANISM="Amphiprora paludosa, Strain CCMP125" /LENGTH=383 /DNA_ID=CAMNT_0013195107 /DNA_START=94 /DNA_END=1245 /DNA_ORIENTATION=+
MRLKSLDLSTTSPERRKSEGALRNVSPITCYSEATEAMMEPISPRSAGPRSLGLDKQTYNLLIGSPQQTEQIGSCPYCRMNNSVEHNCSATPPRMPLEQGGGISNGQSFQAVKKENGETDPASLGIIATSPGEMYRPQTILAEGWLQKKGSGTDWMGSRGWKARWGRLCMAQLVDEVTGPDQSTTYRVKQQLEVPLLLLYWFPASTAVSTAIILDSTVVLGVDLDDKSRWNPFRFEVRHASTKENATLSMTRTFAAPQTARDAWVYAISQALLVYAKAKDQARKKELRGARNARLIMRQNLALQQQQQQGLHRKHATNRPVALGDSVTNSPPAFAQRPLSPPPLHSYRSMPDVDRFASDERRVPLAVTEAPKSTIAAPLSQAV